MYLNFARRCFKWPGVAGARVRPGSAEDELSAGAGDCVLLNFETGLFAVSDSSDRAPGRSREFLLQFDEIVSRHSAAASGSANNITAIRLSREKIEQECEKVLWSMRDSASCTLTGAQILKTDSGITASLFHTGDSCLYEYDPLGRAMSALTESNFWMIGKSVKLFQTSDFRVKPTSVFIFATDGAGCARYESTRRSDAAEIVSRVKVEDIPERLTKPDRPERGMRDDAAAIAIAVSSLRSVKARIIMGGATAEEEREYSELRRSMFYVDSHVPIAQTSQRVDIVL